MLKVKVVKKETEQSAKFMQAKNKIEIKYTTSGDSAKKN